MVPGSRCGAGEAKQNTGRLGKKKKSARPKGIQGAGSLLPAKGWCLKYLAAAKQAPEPEKWVHSARVLEALC